MKQVVSSDFKLGVVGGGQLGKMLIQAASNWDVQMHVLDPNPACSAAHLCHRFVEGSFKDYDTVYQFGKSVDLLTLEIEHVNIEALKQLKAEGLTIHPDPDALAIIQDKGLQKLFYKEKGIPSSRFQLYENTQEIFAALEDDHWSYPFVQKTRKGGYDGKGVAVIKSSDELDELLEGPSLIEEAVDIKKELAVIVARNPQGQTKAFPAVEMEFNPKANLVEQLICPANISEDLEEKARALALRVIESMDLCGILAVELFLDQNDALWVNEVAPRPHNSGHHTIESCFTSQYEQHLRAILDFPLGATDIKLPSVMINLLGEDGFAGPVKYEGLSESFALGGVKVHLYGKKETKPFRKMGHVTIMAPSMKEAKAKADQVKSLLKVKSWPNP